MTVLDKSVYLSSCVLILPATTSELLGMLFRTSRTSLLPVPFHRYYIYNATRCNTSTVGPERIYISDMMVRRTPRELSLTFAERTDGAWGLRHGVEVGS